MGSMTIMFFVAFIFTSYDLFYIYSFLGDIGLLI
jgi:hypothetical protein